MNDKLKNWMTEITSFSGKKEKYEPIKWETKIPRLDEKGGEDENQFAEETKEAEEKRQEKKNDIIDGFAGQVLQGMTAGFYSMDYAHGWKPEEIAKECYDIAEAMYAERSRRNG